MTEPRKRKTDPPAADEPQPPAPAVRSVTADEALTNAARLLHNAECETNLATMERLERLADTWVNIAGLLLEREQD